MDDIALTFNPDMFLKGIDAINNGIGTMNDNFQKFSNEGTQKTQKVGLSMGNLIKGAAVLGIAFAGVRKAMANIPELGRTFSIAGDIMMRNFLWPLRKVLVPMLQKLLDWVRDNRAMFVRWGNVVANIFRIIVSVVKGFINLLKGVWDRIARGIERVFGKTTKTIGDVTNLILFKVAAMAEFLMMTLEPVFDFIVDSFIGMLNAGKNFFNGLATGIGDLMPEFNDLGNSFKGLLNTLSSIDGKGNAVLATFKTLGMVIGVVVGGAVRILTTQIDYLVTNLSVLIKYVQKFNAYRKGDLVAQKRLTGEINEINENFSKRLDERWKRQVDALKSTRTEFGKTWSFMSKKAQQVALPKSTQEAQNFTEGKRRLSLVNPSSPQVRKAPNPRSSVQGAKIIQSRGSVRNVNSVQKKRTTVNNNISMPINIKESRRPQDTANMVGNKVKDILQESKYRSGGR